MLGRVIVSEKSLFQFMKQRIFGMISTKFVLESPGERARMAEPLPNDAILLLSEKERRGHPEWESGGSVRTDPGNAKPPSPGSIGELKWDSGSGTYFGVDPKLDMLYILMEQTQQERGRILPLFKKLVYDAFEQ
jgi:hypothetical protein